MRLFQLIALTVAALTACAALASCGGAGEGELSSTESLSGTGSGDTTSGSPETEEPAPTSFRTENGLGFTADGYSSVEGDLFTIRKEFAITFDEPVVPGGFNRMSFSYSSTGPVKATVSYRLGTVSAVEVFYFEAGERAVFNGLISTYLDGMTGSGIDSIRIKPLKGTTKFELLSDGYRIREGMKAQSAYKLPSGIQMSWSGGEVQFRMTGNAQPMTIYLKAGKEMRYVIIDRVGRVRVSLTPPEN